MAGSRTSKRKQYKPNIAEQEIGWGDEKNTDYDGADELADGWIEIPSPILTYTYVSATQFKVSEDRTAMFTANRGVKANLSGSSPESSVASSSYDGGPDETTVTLNDAILDNTLINAMFFILPFSSPAALSSISRSAAGAITLAAGGSNQDVTLSPSGAGNTILMGRVGVGGTPGEDNLEIKTLSGISTFSVRDQYARGIRITSGVQPSISSLDMDNAPEQLKSWSLRGGILKIWSGADEADIGTEALALTIDASQNFTPGTDNTQNFGKGTERWKEIFAGIGTINTSDARKKIIKGDSLGLEFIKLLKPRSVKFKDEIIDAVTEMRPVEKQKTVKKTVKKQMVELVDGKYIVKIELKEIDDPVFDKYPLYNAAGKALIDVKGKPLIHKVPVMETVDELKVIEPAKNLKYKRKHCLLTAQDVLIALETLGLTGSDFGGYVDGNVDGSGDYFGLRYDEFIAPLIKAVQQIDKKLDEFIAAA